MERLLTGWGRTAPSRADVAAPAGLEDVRAALVAAPARGVAPRGLGRAYGDAAQNAGGTVLDLTGLAGVTAFDRQRGLLTARAGTSLGDLLAETLPHGWVPAVLPGTRHVTVGGAIAADVHGKNHHADGSFGDHLDGVELLGSDGELHALRPGDDALVATLGGMGLTGVVVAATLRLRRVASAHVVVDTERASDLDDVLARLRAETHRYSVAWIDCLARGRRLGRSVVLRGEHAPAGAADPASAPSPGQRRISAPPWVPGGLLNRASVAAFNELYFRRAPRRETGRVAPLPAFFFPLDAVAGWNRLYGPRGFLQYQCLLPFGAEDVLRTVLERLSAAGAASFLAVLKAMGPGRGMLSFPAPGWTLALDVPAAPRLATLLDGLDELVAGAGGRVYLAKDARLRPELLAAMYPELDAWEDVRAKLDPAGVMRSDLARRLGLGVRRLVAA